MVIVNYLIIDNYFNLFVDWKFKYNEQLVKQVNIVKFEIYVYVYKMFQ